MLAGKRRREKSFGFGLKWKNRWASPGINPARGPSLTWAAQSSSRRRWKNCASLRGSASPTPLHPPSPFP